MSRVRSTGGLLVAQVRVGVGLAAGLSPPLLGDAVRRLVGTPRVDETVLGGVPATVFRPPRGRGPWPATVVYPGVTRQGRRHPALVGLGRAFATSGHVAVVPEPDGIARGELTAGTVAQALAVAEAARGRPTVRRGRLALAGVSGGATLALRVAAERSVSEHVTVVLALAPVCDLTEALRFVTTGQRLEHGRLVPFETRDFFRLVCARSLVASLPGGGPRDALLARLGSLPDYGAEPFAALRRWPRDALDASTRATVEFLLNTKPERFDALLAELPPAVRASLDSLSVARRAGAVTAPVELVVGRRDKYVPLEDAAAFAESCPTARLTVLESLEHVVPRLAVREVRELARLDGALVRMLASSYSR